MKESFLQISRTIQILLYPYNFFKICVPHRQKYFNGFKKNCTQNIKKETTKNVFGEPQIFVLTVLTPQPRNLKLAPCFFFTTLSNGAIPTYSFGI